MKKKVECKQRLQYILDYYKITRAEFCRRTGIDNSAMTRYLNGDRVPRQDKVSAIADAFGIDPAWLMGYDVPMTKLENIPLPETTTRQEKRRKERLLAYYERMSRDKKKDLERYAQFLMQQDHKRNERKRG